MDRYHVGKEVGDGTFGNVWRAVDKLSGETVAIKKMKKPYYSWEECLNLIEVKSLLKMNHPNIIKLKEVFREKNMLYFVFEYMECNLYHLMKDGLKMFSETDVRNFCFQVFHALAYMHRNGYFHRDLKPENLLVTKNIIKIADFGLAREVSSDPPFTEYVATRWYRAPEILLQFSEYGPAVDLWAMGAIMAELFTLQPLFPGSSELDEIYKICAVIGGPNSQTWPEGLKHAASMNYQFPMLEKVNLSSIIPSASDHAINLVSSLCSWDPKKRPTAAEALHHSFFQACYYIPPALRTKVNVVTTPPSEVMVSLEQNGPPSASRNNFHNTNVHRKLDMNNHYQIASNQAAIPGLNSAQQQTQPWRPRKKNLDDWTQKNHADVPYATGKIANLSINPGCLRPVNVASQQPSSFGPNLPINPGCLLPVNAAPQQPSSFRPVKGGRHEPHWNNLTQPHQYSRKVK